MNTFRLPILILALLGPGVTLPAAAATLSLLPASADVQPGEVVSLDLVISGLGFEQAPSLGDFDIDLGFDPAALDFVDYTLGGMLGQPGTLQAIDVSFGLFAPGGVNVAEVSLLPAALLDVTQPDSFVLATLDFLITGLGVGARTTVSIDLVFALGDGLGDPIAVDATNDAMFTGAVTIPLPGAFGLFVSALALLALTGLIRPRLRKRSCY